MICAVRTTLDIDEDVLQAAKELAELRGSTAGKMLSDLARRGLKPPGTHGSIRNGVPIMPRRPAGTARTTMQTVNRVRDES